MQIFPRQLNLLAPALGVIGIAAGPVVIGGVWYFGSPENLQVGYTPTQVVTVGESAGAVPYSHALHAGELGIDCRYCHSNVERSQEAMIPPTQTCMGCHAVVRPDSTNLALIRQSWETGESVGWIRVHKLPEHAYFDHSAHLAAGVGCVTCHGRVDQEEVVGVQEGLSMAWCLDCHRDPVPNLRPREEITHMDWEPSDEWTETRRQMELMFAGRHDEDADWDDPIYRESQGVTDEAHALAVNPPEHCSGCHR